MLITEKIKVRVNNKTKSYYLGIGYLSKDGYFDIFVDDLPKSSTLKIKVKCDYCSIEKETSNHLYNKNISYNNKYSCNGRCASEKRKELSLEKYGVGYADKSWSNGNLYNKLGFDLLTTSKPDYKYIVDNIRKHKSNYSKGKLKLKNITENKYMEIKGYNKIWDCGKLKYEKNKK